ncbi:MAG: hypothetical protein ABIE42_09290 [Candidatus Eisenbacteria bacterium]
MPAHAQKIVPTILFRVYVNEGCIQVEAISEILPHVFRDYAAMLGLHRPESVSDLREQR